MDTSPITDTADSIRGLGASTDGSGLVQATSTEYLGRWNRLVSTTNWEKGRIICEWRNALVQASAVPASYTDEAWSCQVGNVTAQHVGRLRRVYQRFGTVRELYPGLYWSHFQAALDWLDAEMWLEGAVQSDWSIAQMRQQRCEALGLAPESQDRDTEVETSELDEDMDASSPATTNEEIRETFGEVHSTSTDEADEEANAYDEVGMGEERLTGVADELPADPARPFENLPTLPADMGEAFEAFKLAILGHKLSGWREISCDDVLSALNALKQLAMAPTGE